MGPNPLMHWIYGDHTVSLETQTFLESTFPLAIPRESG